MRQEIYEVIGKERQPSLSDRNQMHYTEATIFEIQRAATGVFGEWGIFLFQWIINYKTLQKLSAGPEGLFRVTQAPLNAGTCTIPSGHILVTSLREILMGEKSWKDPKRFDPTRFMKAGKFQRDDRVIPFQIGKRICPGESLSKAELFLFLVGLIQKFKFEPAEGPRALVNYDVKPGGVNWKPERHDNINMIRIWLQSCHQPPSPLNSSRENRDYLIVKQDKVFVYVGWCKIKRNSWNTQWVSMSFIIR